MKVVVGASSFAGSSEKALRMLQEKGIEVVKNPYGRKMNEEEIIEHLRGADGLLAGLEPLTDRVFESSPKLKAVARIGIGMDSVDVGAAEKHGIKVSNTPDAPTEAVAEMALAALLAMGHELIASNADVHNKVWKKRIGFSLAGLNVLLIGYGRIGRRFAEHLKYFGSHIIVYDPYQPEISEASLEKALSKADAVSIHASGKEEILTPDLFEYIKDGAVLMNCSRGSLIHEGALYESLKSGKVSKYWGDVFWEEPYEGRILECDNAILTPHISTYNSLCRESMETEAVKNLLEDLGYVE